ncbi:MAG: hypothetical protein AAGC55_16370 [Myxococcota bacterium]
MSEDRPSQRKPVYAVAVWGILGFCAIMANAIWRLLPLAVEPIRDHSLTTMHVIIYVLWVIFMAYSEGYKGFQKQLSPRMAVRGMYAARNPRPLWVILAPLFCMGLFHATRRRLIISWTVTIGVIILVIGVRQLDQPWRGIIDGGVVVGLTWGTLVTLWYGALALAGHLPDVSPDLPETAAERG